MKINDLKIDIYTDAIGLDQIENYASKEWVKGFTTNPTLIKKSGATSYLDFCKAASILANGKPLSLEVISDDLDEMIIQARKLKSLGNNIFVKIPITNTKKIFTSKVIKDLMEDDVNLNITAIMTLHQIDLLLKEIGNKNTKSSVILSIFAGRIADTGRDPMPIMNKAVELVSTLTNVKILWASPREVLNIYQANSIGCHVITATVDLLNKLNLQNKDLHDYSLETVKMFYDDAQSAGYTI